MLNFLSSGSQKQVVGVTLTPGIGLEAVILDKSKTTIVSYGRKKVEYNFSTREIQDYVQFKTAIVELMDEMKIPPKTPAYIVLRNVYFDFLEIPPMISNPEIKTAVLSKAEEFYIFKRDEPVSGWCEVINPEGGSQKKIAYTSFQKSAVDEIKEIISDIGLQIMSIESAYSATLRGLHLTGFLNDIIIEEAPWTAMVINTNSYTLFQLEGKNLLDYTEVPLAIKSFSMEESYQAIISSSSQLLSNFSSTNLFIISQTDDICAEVLKRQMQFDREIIAIDSNKYSKKPLMEVLSATDFNATNSITLAAIGAVDTKESGLNIVLNVLQDDPSVSMGSYFTTTILGSPVEVTSELVDRFTILVVALCAVVFGALIGLCYFADTQTQNGISDLNSQIQTVDAQINAESQGEKKQEVDMNMVIDEVAASNVNAINFYDSIATDIPKNVWLTRYYNQDGSKIAVRGIAASIVDIYEYYKNLRIVSPQSDIKLTELKVVTEDMDSQDSKFISDLALDKDSDRLYSFEISNTQIQMDSDPKAKEEKNENDIIIRSENTEQLEQPSSQMKPAK